MARMACLAKRIEERKKYKEAKKKFPVGHGGRFRALAASAKAGGAKNPEAVAAAVGRAKYGASRFAKMAAAARKK